MHTTAPIGCPPLTILAVVITNPESFLPPAAVLGLTAVCLAAVVAALASEFRRWS